MAKMWTHPSRRTTHTLLLPLVLCAGLLQAQEPRIEITYIPRYGSYEHLRGRVFNADPAAHHVATYLFLEGKGWWVKPYADPALRCTPIQATGDFEVNVTTGGVDEFAHRYVVFLLPLDQDCPVAADAEFLPPDLFTRPYDLVERTPFTLQFSGYTWVRRDSPYNGGPGSNCFSPDHAFVDAQGRLHLRLAPVPPQGFCTATVRGGEIWLGQSLGYGDYLIHTFGRVLDSKTVFGMFTWDPDGMPAHREMDIELSRWCAPNDPDDAQFVVKPFDPVRFQAGPLMTRRRLTFLVRWVPGAVTFSAYRGHHFGQPPADSLIFQHIFTKGVPDPGQERFRFNLWTNCPSTQSQEVVVTYFSHVAFADLSMGKTSGRVAAIGPPIAP